jgi:hypothetical protein
MDREISAKWAAISALAPCRTNHGMLMECVRSERKGISFPLTFVLTFLLRFDG